MNINKKYHTDTMMKTMKWMLPVLLLGMTVSVNAQTEEETEVSEEAVTPAKVVEKGYNRIQLDYVGTWWTGSDTGFGGSSFRKTAAVTEDKDLFWGFDFGYLRGIRLVKKLPLYVEVGATMVYSSIDNTETNPGVATGEDQCDVTVRALSFEVPVFLTYRFKFANNIHLAPYIGAKFRANAMMKLAYVRSVRGEKFETNDLFDCESYTVDDEEYTSKYRRFQACGEVGVNFGWKALNLKVAYFYNSSIYKGENLLHEEINCGQMGVIAGVGVEF